ncbi:MAG: hypothetical protein ACYDGW_03300 [Vulcanimicrobiaceae bacterium]
MNDVQRKACAAGFIHALQQSPDLFRTWLKTPKNDAHAIGALVQQALGLAATPSHEDLTAMASHATGNLRPQLTALQTLDPAVPAENGIIMLHHE